MWANVVCGMLRLKGKILDVKGGGTKNKKEHMHHSELESRNRADELPTGGDIVLSSNEKVAKETANQAEGSPNTYDGHLTPAERRYLEHWKKIDTCRRVQCANKGPRDRIQELNQYLANLSEHYDTPKVGPG